VQDARFQQLMPDTLHWLGITRIDRLVSMSNLKYDALIDAGIEIGERVALPPGLVPQDAMVEIEAKKAAGYFTSDTEIPVLDDDPPCVVGRELKDY
jgi:GTP cyclohydrolase II